MRKVTVYRTKDLLFTKLANLLTDVDTVLSDEMLLGVISVGPMHVREAWFCKCAVPNLLRLGTHFWGF